MNLWLWYHYWVFREGITGSI